MRIEQRQLPLELKTTQSKSTAEAGKGGGCIERRLGFAAALRWRTDGPAILLLAYERRHMIFLPFASSFCSRFLFLPPPRTFCSCPQASSSAAGYSEQGVRAARAAAQTSGVLVQTELEVLFDPGREYHDTMPLLPQQAPPTSSAHLDLESDHHDNEFAHHSLKSDHHGSESSRRSLESEHHDSKSARRSLDRTTKGGYSVCVTTWWIHAGIPRTEARQARRPLARWSSGAREKKNAREKREKTREE
nr:unnamed protein product [Digitaria exilis]